jgi:response regulator RpfG family c-di-GMP phosphodiesterase
VSSEPAWVGNNPPVVGAPLHQVLEDPRRLQALAATGLLDDPRTDAFGRISRLTRAIFGVSFAAVSLLDRDRELHAGIAGFPGRGTPSELPIERSLACRVVVGCEAFVVEDARADPSLAADPAFVAQGVGACAVLPLVDPEGHVLGALGAFDRLPRGWSPRDLDILRDLARSAMSEVELATACREDAQRRSALERLVHDRTASLELATLRVKQSELDLRASHEQTIRRLSRAIEARNRETGWHVERMSRYAALIAHRVGVDAERCELIRIAAPLHDIGKIAVPDSVLLKAGRLTREERAVMETHAELGHQMLCGSDEELLELAATIAWTHHERVDGEGYPRGLRGDDVPVEGQIAAVADVFDALISDRVYRQAFSFDEAVNVLRLGRGTHFDPAIVDAFLDAVDDVAAIKDRFADLHRNEPDLLAV